MVHWNLLGSEGTLELNTKVGMISTANKVPPTLTPKVIEKNILDDEDDEKYNVSWPKWTCHILNQK